MRTLCYRAWIALAAIAILAGAGRTNAGPAPPRLAPQVAFADVDGKKHTLAEYRGRPVTLLVVCGCSYCPPVARLWGQVQRSEAEKPSPPVFLVAFAGDAAQARAFAAAQGLEAKRSVLIPDARTEVAVAFDAVPCPRLFVIDAQGAIRYTNNGT